MKAKMQAITLTVEVTQLKGSSAGIHTQVSQCQDAEPLCCHV